MAKGRKLTITRSERFFGYDGNNHDTEDAGIELGEDDVWSMVDHMVNGPTAGGGEQHSVRGEWNSRASMEGGTKSPRHRTRLLPLGSAGGLSVAFDDPDKKMTTTSQRIVHQFRNGSDNMASSRERHLATSAPVNVPDWSKIYRVDSVESMHDSDDGTDDHNSDMVPPHEYLARSHRSAAKSVFEGVGRTLKGRDMSRVRDAVWSQTGFDG